MSAQPIVSPAAVSRLMGSFARRVFKSPLVGVNDAAWDRFVVAMSTQAICGKSRYGGLGSFDLTPKRLGELGVLTNMRRQAKPPGLWIGDFVAPYTETKFLRDAEEQYVLFKRSTKLYDDELTHIARPEGVSRSGALAIMHRGGSEALTSWPARGFKTTREVFARANNLF